MDILIIWLSGFMKYVITCREKGQFNPVWGRLETILKIVLRDLIKQ